MREKYKEYYNFLIKEFGMQSIFTIHAGEYLVGSHIEQHYKDFNVWIPSKDTGIDLLLTNKTNNKTCSLQVKFSKDFSRTHLDEFFQGNIQAWGWWTLKKSKIQKSQADFWVFVLHRFNQRELLFAIFNPEELLAVFNRLKRKNEIIQCYLWVTKHNECWETRGLSKTDKKVYWFSVKWTNPIFFIRLSLPSARKGKRFY